MNCSKHSKLTKWEVLRSGIKNYFPKKRLSVRLTSRAQFQFLTFPWPMPDLFLCILFFTSLLTSSRLAATSVLPPMSTIDVSSIRGNGKKSKKESRGNIVGYTVQTFIVRWIFADQEVNALATDSLKTARSRPSLQFCEYVNSISLLISHWMSIRLWVSSRSTGKHQFLAQKLIKPLHTYLFKKCSQIPLWMSLQNIACC